jgi:DNA-binding response OmpR family regulator
MARILLLDGDVCLWNSVCEILEGEGYTVCRAHNDDEGLPPTRTGSMTLTTRPMQYVVLL